MVENNEDFQEKVRNSFKKARDDIYSIKKELNTQKEDVKDIKSKINNILNLLKEKKDDKTFFKTSNGNDGVAGGGRRWAAVGDTGQHQATSDKDISKFEDNVVQKLRILSDREFSIFLAIYQLEEELRREVTYDDISLHLNISKSRIRDKLIDLFNYGVPIEKNRFLNGKVSLSIKKEVRSLNIITKLLKLRGSDDKQARLPDN